MPRCKRCGGNILIDDEYLICLACGARYEPAAAVKPSEPVAVVARETRLEEPRCKSEISTKNAS